MSYDAIINSSNDNHLPIPVVLPPLSLPLVGRASTVSGLQQLHNYTNIKNNNVGHSVSNTHQNHDTGGNTSCRSSRRSIDHTAVQIEQL